MAVFVDFIPEGQDTGAQGKRGFVDYVPEPEPRPQVVDEVPVETKQDIKQKKGKK